MKKYYSLLLAASCFFYIPLFSQNDLALSVPSGDILAPSSGCGLTNAEIVTVRIFNFGPGTVNVPFQVSYNITGPINSSATEVVPAPNIPPNTSFIYSFTTTANLSLPGIYTVNATVTLGGDPNSSNDSYTGYVVEHYSPSVGGTVNSSMNVCYNSNSGNLTLTGHTGSVLNWEYSTDGGVTWFNIGNPTTIQPYNNITVTTQYRALVQNASCTPAYSTVATLTVDPTSVGGTISGSNTICSGSNVNLTLSGYTGNIIQWEYSTNGGATWNPIAFTGSTYSTVLTQTTQFRVLVQSGVCPAVYSSIKTVTVNPNSVGGSVTPASQTVCSGNNSGILTLTGYVGSIVRWQYSTNGGATWTNINNTTPTQSFSNLTVTTMYRAQVKSGVCPQVNSAPATVTVVPSSNGGNISPASVNICSGNNNDTLFLGGHVGSVQDWEYSTDGGLTWISTGISSDTLVYSNISVNTQYRAIVQAGSCPSDYSDTAYLIVSPVSVGGTLNSNDTVCILSNTGMLTLTGYTGNVTQWEYSVNNGTTWTPITNTSPTYTFNNLTDTTLFRVMVTSGVCPPGYSDTVEIIVDTATVAGLVTGGTTVCELSNSGLLTLNGNNGNVLNWEVSTDGGLSWGIINNTTTTLSYNNITATSLFRANVKNGVCPSAYSMYDIVYVDKASQGGTVIGSSTACEGSNNGVLTLVGHYGNILYWEYSTDGGSTWNSIPNTSYQQNYTNLALTTLYRVILQSGVCPSDTSVEATITILPKPAAQFTSDTVCLGQPINFINGTTIPSGYFVLNNWDFGDGSSATNNNPTHTYADTGNYTVQLIAMSNFGCLDTFISNARVEPLPNVLISSSGNLAFCQGNNVSLSINTPSNNTIYQWNTGSTSLSIMADTSGSYMIYATDTLTGCKDSSSIEVTVFPLPTVNAGNDTTIALGQSIQLQGAGGITYEWTPADLLQNPNSPNPVATPLSTTIFIMTAYNAYGCAATDSVKVTVTEEIAFVIYDIITPNNDGYNDKWEIKNIQLFPDNEVTVFNRQGNIVYQKSGYDNSWDGSYNGKPLPQGTYYFILKINSINKTQRGAINIVSSN